MKKLFLTAAMLAVLGSAASAFAGNIVLARFGGGTNTIYPSGPDNTGPWFTAYGTNNCDHLGYWTDQNDLLWTNTDDTFIAALTNAGHHVQAFWIHNNNISDTDLLRLNTNDLVILDFTVNSGAANMGNSANTGTLCNSTNTGRKWNTLVTAPLILTKANLGRQGSGRMGWFSSIGSNDWATASFSQVTPSDFDSANDKSTTASGKLTFVDTINPLFSGITYTNDGGGNRVMSNYFTVDISQNLSHPQLVNYFKPSIPYPGPVSAGGIVWDANGDLYNRGNTPATLKIVVGGVSQGPGGAGDTYTNDLSPGGRILATMEFNPMTDPAATPSSGDNPPQGTAPVPDPTWVVTGVAIAEWPVGSKVWRNCGDPTMGTATFCDTFGGYRMFMAVGTRDPQITTQDAATGGRGQGFFAGAWNVTVDGEKIFRRAVDRAILKGNLPSLSVAKPGGNVTVSWNTAVTTWKLQKSTDLTSWSDVPSGVVNNSYAVPSPLGSATFYRLAVK